MYPSAPAPRQSMDTGTPLSPVSRSEASLLKLGQTFSRPRPRRDSTASSIHSIGGHLDTSSSSWSRAVLESGQNAISTLLQPPIVRTGLQPHTSAPASSLHKPPTSREIPPVPLTNIPRIESSEFAQYLSQVGALYEQLQRAKEFEDDARMRRSSKTSDDPFDGFDEGRRTGAARGHGSRQGSVSSITTPIERPATVRRGSNASSYSRKGGAQGPPPLSTIPTVYFEEDFHLENPRTFDVVSERSDVVPPSPTDERWGSNGNAPAPRKALATNAILQEKLSWYMDTVEVHLINSISTASMTFFSALGSLRELHSEAADSVERIKVLRKELAGLNEEIVSRGLELLQKRQKRHNLQQLSDAVLQLKRIVDGVAHCESLVEAGKVEAALAEIDALEGLIAGERDETFNDETLANVQLRDMRGAVALQGIANDILILRQRIGRLFETKVHSLLIADLRRHVESISTPEVLMRWGAASMRAKGGHGREPSAFPSYMTMTDELRAALLPNIAGLHRSKSISPAIQTYRELVIKEVKSLVRKHLPSSQDDDAESVMSASTMSGGGRGRSNQEKSSMLARNIRALDAEDAEELFANIYVGITETLRRVATQAKVLLDVASAVGNPDASGARTPTLRSPMTSPNPTSKQDASLFEIQEEMHVALDLAHTLGYAVDVGHDKINKILRVRSEQTTSLPLPHFLRYFTLNLFFANECEAISGRSGTSLKTVVNGHIKDFVKDHGDREIQTLAQGMGADNWLAKDFTPKHTEMLQEILECSTSDPVAWAETSKIWIPLSAGQSSQEDDAINGTPAGEPNGTTTGSSSKVRGAVVEEETYLVPNSAVLCLEGMARFLHLMCGIPSMTPDVAASLVAYLHLFNSRCTQLILGAGATKSAGLRNITTKHLALASQALAFVAAVIPHVREFVRRHAPPSSSSSSLTPSTPTTATAGGIGAGGSGIGGTSTTSSSSSQTQSATAEFDKVRRVFQEHQDSIYQKLVEIMSARARGLSKKARETDWEAADPEAASRPYAFDLAKDTGTLYKVLSRHLPERAVGLVMVPVFTSYKDQLGKAYKEADPKTETGRDCMLRDVEHLTNKLGKIEGFGDLGTYLIKIIESKDIKKAAPPPPPPAAVVENAAENASSPPLTDEKEAMETTEGNEEKDDEPAEAAASLAASKGGKDDE